MGLYSFWWIEADYLVTVETIERFPPIDLRRL
jgi:hypothetical protein